MKIMRTHSCHRLSGLDLRLGSAPQRLNSRQASALIVTLAFVVLITIAIVGFVTTAGMERAVVQSQMGRTQAELYSSMAANVVASRIVMATSPTNSWWVSQPGRIAATTFSGSTTTFFNLHSGAADTNAVEDFSVDLNPASLVRGSRAVTGNQVLTNNPSAALPVQWIYVRENGSHEAADTVDLTYNQANPLTGRYAYWTDDESARINVNTATAPTSVALDLTPLSTSSSGTSWPADVQADRGLRTFNSVEDLKSTDATPFPIASVVEENKAALSPFNHSSNLNRFGEQRFVLTTQASKAFGQPFLDILTGTSGYIDPGDTANISPAKIEDLFVQLYPYFEKTASQWGLPGPVASTQTMVDKYTSAGVAQIIINLIDYVRSVESIQPIVLPTRGAYSGGVFTCAEVNSGATGIYGPNAIEGNSRRLHIVEMGMFVQPTPPINTVTLKVKLFCDYGIGSTIDLTNLFLQCAVTSAPFSFDENHDIAASDIVGGDNTIGPGEYRTLSISITLTTPLVIRPAVLTNFELRMAIKSASGDSYDIAPVADSPGIDYPLDADTIVEANISSVSADDPVINQNPADWNLNTGGNSFGTPTTSPPGSTIGTPYGSISPQQDTDSSGDITDVGVQPPILGEPIWSVGDLGRIHSGGKGTSTAGVPWRTIRLQPRKDNSELPDWLLLDLFTAPVQASGEDTIAGRINLNSAIDPFVDTQFPRTAPLRTLFRTAKPSLDNNAADILADAVLAQTLATNTLAAGTAFGTSDLIGAKLYPMPGEISEVKGIADGGEESEPFARQLVGRLTAQSNIFSVFAVGEKIQQTPPPSSIIKVLGQTRTCTVLERYLDKTTLPPTWKVRTLSTTELGQ